jgi:hypothetical protein
MPDGLEANGTPRPRGRIFPRKALRKEPRARQRRRVGRLAHLVNAELPLHEEDDPPMVEVREDRSCPNPASARIFNGVRSESSRA